jgi:hypothetical protein
MLDITMKTIVNKLKIVDVDNNAPNQITEGELYDQITSMMN